MRKDAEFQHLSHVARIASSCQLWKHAWKQHVSSQTRNSKSQAQQAMNSYLFIMSMLYRPYKMAIHDDHTRSNVH